MLFHSNKLKSTNHFWLHPILFRYCIYFNIGLVFPPLKLIKLPFWNFCDLLREFSVLFSLCSYSVVNPITVVGCLLERMETGGKRRHRTSKRIMTSRKCSGRKLLAYGCESRCRSCCCCTPQPERCCQCRIWAAQAQTQTPHRLPSVYQSCSFWVWSHSWSLTDTSEQKNNKKPLEVFSAADSVDLTGLTESAAKSSFPVGLLSSTETSATNIHIFLLHELVMEPNPSRSVIMEWCGIMDTSLQPLATWPARTVYTTQWNS